MDLNELLKTAADPHLVASAAKANELLARLNFEIQQLRAEVGELELQSDIHHNLLLQQENKSIALKESEWRISEIYRTWKKKAGLLSDVRAVRRNLQRHCDILYDQEKYSNKYNNKFGAY